MCFGGFWNKVRLFELAAGVPVEIKSFHRTMKAHRGCWRGVASLITTWTLVATKSVQLSSHQSSYGLPRLLLQQFQMFASYCWALKVCPGLLHTSVNFSARMCRIIFLELLLHHLHHGVLHALLRTDGGGTARLLRPLALQLANTKQLSLRHTVRSLSQLTTSCPAPPL